MIGDTLLTPPVPLQSRQASASMSAPVSPMTASNNAVVAPAAAAAPVRAQHTRTASGVESLQGTKIEEEPVNTTESPVRHCASYTEDFDPRD